MSSRQNWGISSEDSERKNRIWNQKDMGPREVSGHGVGLHSRIKSSFTYISLQELHWVKSLSPTVFCTDFLDGLATDLIDDSWLYRSSS